MKDIGYDEFGQRVEMEYGNGVRTEYTYNPERRWLERIVTTGGTGSVLQNIWTLPR
jgi:YD repeat-containing protein